MNMNTPAIGVERRQTWQLAVFTLGGAALLACVALAWFRLRGASSNDLQVHFIAPSALHLWAGQPLRLSGLRIGEVTDFTLAPDARIEVRARIKAEYANWLHADAVVAPDKDGLIGDSFIAITPGSAATAPLASDMQLAYAPGDSLEAQLQRALAQAQDTFTDLHVFLAAANDQDGDLHRSLAELHGLLGELRGTRAKADQNLVALRGTLLKLDGSIGAMQTRAEQLGTQSEATLQQYGVLAQQTQATVESLQGLIVDARPKLQETLDHSAAASEHLDRAVQAARTRWPFSSKLDEPPPPPP